MCRPVRCKQCDKITWAGCGQHVAAVRAMVPDDNWCPGHDGQKPPRKPGHLFRRRSRSAESS
ncbi:MAG: hypothetical protein P1U38_16695 [Aeromicrobium sp.]|uniref:hypothetical protein n=1 Tax=Aeromicrobium sp. TaxID=1871063 RepID=UPI00263661AF|nr:hypothetical protein [Aeromicrobium sp.]MDF1706405.1 hypothetical protein [Aeromicrobium sp.]